MRKVVLTTLAILIVAAFTFGGCKKKTEPTSPNTVTPAEKTTQTQTEKPKTAAPSTEKPVTPPAEKPAGQ